MMNEMTNQGPFIELVALQAAAYGMVKLFVRQEKIPLKIEQLPVMMCIYDHGILCQQEIADAVFRDKSSVQRTVAKLEDQGLINIHRDKDRRKKLLTLSQSGKEVARRIAAFIPASGQENGISELNGKMEAKFRLIFERIPSLRGVD